VPFVQPVNALQMMKFPYPPWVVVTKDGLNQENLATKGNAALIMPYTSSVKTIPEKLPTGEGKFKVDVLAKSTADSWAQANFAFLDPSRMEDMLSAPKQNVGTYNLAVMVTGKFSSQYATQAPPKEAPTSWLKAAEKEATILVLGSAYTFSNLTFILSEMTGLPLLEENNKMLFAAIDIMQGNQELVELRKKAKPNIRPKLVEDTGRKILTLLAFAIPLMIIAAAGVARLYKRREQKLLKVEVVKMPATGGN
jgi:hypothetical protein